jgi:enterochelin esterase-like enzyme
MKAYHTVKYYCTTWVILLFALPELLSQSESGLPLVKSGTIERIPWFQSRYISARHLDVWLPEGYTDTGGKYPVLYVHDGQMLFDPTMTWNGQAWKIEEVIRWLTDSGYIQPCIVVGIWNSPQRHAEYFPQSPFQQMSPSEKDTVTGQLQMAQRINQAFAPLSDLYLKCLVEEIKPFIDSRYAVYSDAAHTGIMGSSMGGLISIYAVCEYPLVFGMAACLSTHWTGTFTTQNNPIPSYFMRYLSDHLPPAQHHRLYFDCGDKNLDALYPQIQQQVDSIMLEKGYPVSLWQTRYFPGEDHSESAWHKRLHIPLTFLLGKGYENK